MHSSEGTREESNLTMLCNSVLHTGSAKKNQAEQGGKSTCGLTRDRGSVKAPLSTFVAFL